MRSRAVWALLLVACATQKPQAPAKPAAPSALPVQATAPSVRGPGERPTDDQLCQADGYDFAYTFVENNGVREMACGDGPGTPCSGNSCDGAHLLFCHEGRLGMLDCLVQCRDVGDAQGLTYDSGTCSVRDAIPQCVCCDAAEPGCETVKPRSLSPVAPDGVRLAAPS